MTDKRHSRSKTVVLLAAAVLLVGAVGFFVGQGSLAADAGESAKQLQFAVSCKSTDEGAVTCTLNVTGLPEPLQNDVSVTLLSTEGAADAPDGAAPTGAVISADVPTTAFDTPLFVSRELSLAPPRLVANLPQVPHQPPKSL